MATWSQEQLYAEIQLIRSRSVAALLCRTLETPDLERLASYVRTVTVEWDVLYDQRTMDFEFRFLLEASTVHGSPSHAARSMDEQIWHLLQLLPRVEVLVLKPFAYYRPIYGFINRILEPEVLPIARQSVRHFAYYSNATAELLLAMLQIPRIRALEVWGLTEIEVPLPTTDYHTSGVTDLLMLHCRLDIPSLGHILQIPRALTRLTLTGYFPSQHVELAVMEAALEPVRMTLQHLEVHIKVYEIRPSVTFLVLRTWPVLRRLWCPLNWLLGKWTADAELHLEHVLPRGLRDFSVYGDFNWSHEQQARELVGLVERKEEAVPLLEMVCIDRDEKSDAEKQPSSVCADAGVVLTGMGERWSV